MITRLAGLKLAGLFFVHSLHAGKDRVRDRLGDVEFVEARVQVPVMGC